jgi:hypothetical protein
MNEIKPVKPIVSFKGVHEAFENEYLFLKKNHDIRKFNEKGTFLKNIGFGNSIATKIYNSIAKNANIIDEYEKKYLK